jgi:hypothetical protein
MRKYAGRFYGSPTMIRVTWVDKNDGASRSKAFSWMPPAVREAAWLRSQGHADVHVLDRGTRPR